MAKKRKKKVKKKSKAKRRKPARKAAKPTKKNRLIERELDEGLRETFPASDAPAVTDPTRSIKE
jgi:hypothetical protein